MDRIGPKKGNAKRKALAKRVLPAGFRRPNSNASADIIRQLESQIQSLIAEHQQLSKRAVALKRSNMRLAELNRAKDEFIAVASHQLRTPATGVKQYIRLLLDGYGEPLTKNQTFFLEKANESNDRQLKIIDDLLQVARIDAGNIRLNLKEFNIIKMLQDVIHGLGAKSDLHKQKMIYEPAAKVIKIKADAERLRMVFENIIDNAINYSQAKTNIYVSARKYKNDLIVAVRDEGVGISRSDFPKLFQKFSRIPNRLSVEVGGTGLGLYWAQKMIKLHGGDIKVKSKPGEGSTFTITLPLSR